MIVVTGGAGFIGSNLIAALNLRGRRDVILVDDLSDTAKIQNISDLTMTDYIDKDHFQKIANVSASYIKTTSLPFSPFENYWFRQVNALILTFVDTN